MWLSNICKPSVLPGASLTIVWHYNNCGIWKMCQSAMVNCKVTTSSGTWLKIYSGLKIPPFSKINRPWLPELPGRKVGWGVSPIHSAMILWFDKKFFTNFQKIHYSKLSHSEKASKFEKISHLFWRYWVNIKISDSPKVS